MATAAEIAALRLLIAEPSQTPYSDVALGLLLDAADGSSDQVAYDVWVNKAATYVTLVDISEGGSQRKNSDLLKNAQLMIALFRGRLDETILGGTRTVIRKLTRT